MRKVILFLAVVAAVLAFNVGTGSAFAASCGNTLGADGHAGPWYTSSNMALHGNTVTVSCPSGSTFWKLDYVIQWSGDGGSTWHNYVYDLNISGNGSTSFNESWNPITCDGGLHIWRTHVHNDVTNGNVNRPSGGGGVFLGC